jgi:hypothetical protein
LLEGGLLFGFRLALGDVSLEPSFVVTHELGFCFPLGLFLANFLLQSPLARELLPGLMLSALEQKGLLTRGNLVISHSQELDASGASGGQTRLLRRHGCGDAFGVLLARALALAELSLGALGARHLRREALRQGFGALVAQLAQGLQRVVGARHDR